MNGYVLGGLMVSAVLGCGGITSSVMDELKPRPVTPPQSELEPGPALQTWLTLLDSGCDLKRVPVWTPVEARILRNVAFAKKGRAFVSEELTVFFQADGGWYHPQHSEVDPLDTEAAACVAHLKRHESTLQREMPIPETLRNRMTRDHALFERLRKWGQSPKTPYARPRFSTDGEGTLSMYTEYADCEPNPDEEMECGGYSVGCPVQGPCMGVAAG